MPIRILPQPFLFVIVLAAVLLFGGEDTRADDDVPSFSATLVEFNGDVTLQHRGEDLWLPVDTDIPVEEGDRLRTGEDGSAEILMDDGSVVRMEEGTEITLEELAADCQDQRILSTMALWFGRILCTVQKLVHRESRFQVRTPTLVAAVRGTDFVVESTTEEETDVGVFEGDVAVLGLDQQGRTIQDSEILVSRDRQVSVARFRRPGRPIPLKKRMLAHRKRIERLRKKAIERRRLLPQIIHRRNAARQRILKRWQQLRKPLLKRRLLKKRQQILKSRRDRRAPRRLPRQNPSKRKQNP